MGKVSNSVLHTQFSPFNNAAVDYATDGGATRRSATAPSYKLISPPELPISRSTCIAAPSGFSATPFPESPILLPRVKAEPSPTTGSFFKSPFMQSSGDTATPCVEKNCFSSIDVHNKASCRSFEFKLHTGSSASGLSPQMIPAVQNGPACQIQDQLFSQSSVPLSTLTEDGQPSSEELKISAPVDMHNSPICGMVDELNHDVQSNSSILMSYSDQKDSIFLTTAGKKTDEGYNWRKYGQKVVKGSEFPRSYYKCTYPNCEVRKIFERAPSGQITEIVYKGSHDHPKPQATRRHNPGALMPLHDETMEKSLSSFTGQDDKQHTNIMEQNVSPALSPRQANESLAGPGSQIQGTNDDIDLDDQYSKLRKIEDGLDFATVVKPIREPRVIVQTMSEVDILDDGYRWRKYGQKVVRGNPNPRSYYKCTVARCTVRKHVERASHDPKAVLTTYEGKHNHDLPTAKTTNREFAVTGTSNTRAEGSASSVSLDLGVGISHFASTRADDQVLPSGASQNLTGYGIMNSG